MARAGSWLAAGLVLTGVAAATLSSAGQAVEKPASQQEKVKLSMAVVDYQVLIKAHPDYERLVQLDEQLRLLREEKAFLPLSDRETAEAEGAKEMEAEVSKARQKLLAEKARIESEMQSLSSALAGQMEAEMRKLQSAYEGQLKQELGGAAPPQDRPNLNQSAQAQMEEFLQNLSLLRERNMAARRLEMEKRISAELEAEKQRLDSQAATFEDELGGQHQSERLNLQLKLQNAATEEERQEAEAALQAIAEDISTKKAARRETLDAEFAEFRVRKERELESELSAYQKTLDTEVAQKAAAKQSQLAGVAPPPPVPEGPPPGAAAKIKAIEGRLQGEFEAKKRALQARMESESQVARQQLEAKQKEVEKHLKEVGDQITRRIQEQIANVSEDTQAKIDAVQKQIEEVEKQREEMYRSMVADLNGAVKEVAVKKEADMVIGAFVLNREYDDLTDLAMVAVKQMENGSL